MQLQRSEDTGLELTLRKALHGRGLRFRVHRPIVDGTRRRVDIVFGPSKVAVDVRGCFWHGHPHEFTEYERRHNLAYWTPKIARNRARDEDTAQRLLSAGWHLIVVWACDDLVEAVELIQDAVRQRRPT